MNPPKLFIDGRGNVGIQHGVIIASEAGGIPGKSASN
jgi:hypothetical protein